MISQTQTIVTPLTPLLPRRIYLTRLLHQHPIHVAIHTALFTLYLYEKKLCLFCRVERCAEGSSGPGVETWPHSCNDYRTLLEVCATLAVAY